MLRKTYNIISPERENVYQKVLVDWKTNVFFLQHGRSVCRNQGVKETQICLFRQKGVDRKLDKFIADGFTAMVSCPAIPLMKSFCLLRRS
jgi:hypothetical protein